MSSIIQFYQNKIKANDKEGYYIKDILKWSDYKLEIEHDFIQWLFPDKTGGVTRTPKLTNNDIEIFKTDQKIRRKVIRATARMLLFYGFIFVKNGVKQVKKLDRKENGIYVGLYSEHNYKRISRMMFFLNRIDMRLASSLMMLAMCFSMQKDRVLQYKISNSGSLKHWFSTQNYLVPYFDNYDIRYLQKSDESDNICKFIGLKYTGNSCYQDSVLLALFALPNKFVTKNILNKDVRLISSKINRDIICGIKENDDYNKRLMIQNELIRITGSMRRDIPVEERVQYCSNLRSLLKGCPSSSKQAFYSTLTQDAGEFLQYLFSLFQVNGLYRIRITDVTNDLSNIPNKTLTIRQIEEETSPIVLIPETIIEKFPETNIDNYLTQTEDSVLDKDNLYKGPDGKKYMRRIEKTIVTKGKYIVFYAQRLFLTGGKEKRIYNKIIPVEKIILPMSEKPLQLFAIVVHKNVHYTCYIKCDEENWFYYDDTKSEIRPIGKYQDVLKSSPSVESEGVLYFYKV